MPHSLNDAVRVLIEARAAYDEDSYEAFDSDELDDALAWASEAAESDGDTYAVLWCPEQDEFRVGPVDDLDTIAVASAGCVIVAVYDADGELSAVDPSTLSKTENLQIAAYNCDFAILGERVVKRRSVYDRRHALRTKKTVMDKTRRQKARNAKLWRLRNKSRAKRYGSLYHGPKTKVKEAAVHEGPEWRDVVVDEEGAVVREATDAEVLEAINMGGPLVIERRRVRP